VSWAKASSSISGIGSSSIGFSVLLIALGLFFAMALTASPASAAKVHPFKEIFGSAAQPSFAKPESVAVDQATGDLLAVDAGANEKQEVEIKVTSGAVGGTYKLSFGGQTTGWSGQATLTGESGTGDTSGCEAKGDFTASSNEIKNVAITTGACAVGQQFEGTLGVTDGTTITEINGTTYKMSANASSTSAARIFKAGSKLVTNVSGGPYVVGHTITATGIQALTTISACSPSCSGATSLTLSKIATNVGTAVPLVAGSKSVTGAITTTGKLSNGEEISGPGIQAGTTLSAINEGAGTFTLSQPPSITGGSSLSAALPFAVSAANLREALEKLSSIGAGNVNVTSGSTTTNLVKRPIEFKSSLGGKDVESISCDGSGLTGTSPTCIVSTPVTGVPYGIKRFNPDGTPANFSALGTNLIDGRKGTGGKTCGEEPSSCDATPQANGLGIDASNEIQVAIAPAGSAGGTAGDIYVSQSSAGLIDIFAADGHYLGQLKEFEKAQKITFTTFSSGNTFSLGNLPEDCSNPTTAPITYSTNSTTRATNIRIALEARCGSGNFAVTAATAPLVTFQGKYAEKNVPLMTCAKETGAGTCAIVAPGPVPFLEESPCGVTVDPVGSVYIPEFERSLIHRYGPSASPPVTGDNTVNFKSTNPCSVAAGAGPTEGFIFATQASGPITKLDRSTGAVKYTVAPGTNTTVAVNPADGHVLAASGNGVNEYDASGATEATQTSTLTAPSEVDGVAVNKTTGNVYISRAGGANLEVYLPPASGPISLAKPATGITGTKATLNGSVNPEFGAIEECKFEFLTDAAYQAASNSFNGTGPNTPVSTPCVGPIPTDSNPHDVSAAIGGLIPQGTTYHFRVTAKNFVAKVSSSQRTFTTASTVVTEAATAISGTTATLNGTLRIEEDDPFTACVFEYLTDAEYAANGGSYSGPDAPHTKPCTPSVASIAADFESHPVSASLTGLTKNTAYHFRLVATNSGGAVRGEDRRLTTPGPPQVVEEFAGPVGRSAATLNVSLNPSGFATTYHFEWGTQEDYEKGEYGARIPADFDPFAGLGTSPVRVTASLSGLQEATRYHFRLLATNSAGTTVGPDQEFATLNAAGLPDHRGVELVSPADKRPVGNVENFAFNQVNYQVAESGEAASYLLLNGLGDTLAGGNTVYSASRSTGGWASAEVSPPSLISHEGSGEASGVGNIRYFSPEDLKCGIVESFNPLTADTPRASVELGVFNLYRWNSSDATYTLITTRLPLNPGTDGYNFGAFYEVAGASADCSRIFFRSPYSFFAGASKVYEWDNGTLRDAAVLPDRSVPTGDLFSTESGGVAGQAPELARAKNTVSPDGRLFFAATSDEPTVAGVTPGDADKPAVFVRKSPTETVDASLPTNGATRGAGYETASPDGSRVFFLANYGIAATSSSGPVNDDCSHISEGMNNGASSRACDLYEYNVGSSDLTDLSADTNFADANGATVQGVMAVSRDGSVVYFAARGQLVLGKGRTYAQNLAGAGFANVYRRQAGTLTYVGSLANKDLGGSGTRGQALIHPVSGAQAIAGDWAAQTNGAGTYFLFASADNMTGTNPAEVDEAYLFSAATGATECVSCPRDGSAPHARIGEEVVGHAGAALAAMGNEYAGVANYTPVSLSEDGRVIFASEDALAPGAVEGHGKTFGTALHHISAENNLYEWHRGQVSLLTTGRFEMIGMGGPDGRDVFLRTYEQLDSHDFDFNSDLYDFRSFGGFAPPPKPQTPCDPDADQCQPPPTQVPGAPSPETSGQPMAGNPPLAPLKKKHKKHKGNKKHHGRATGNRGGGK
jgi:hypothetical protein